MEDYTQKYFTNVGNVENECYYVYNLNKPRVLNYTPVLTL